jgi:hypothetical protein
MQTEQVRIQDDTIPAVGSRWVAKWANDLAPYVWTVKGVTQHGIYITSPQSRTPGHLISRPDFARDYVAAPSSIMADHDRWQAQALQDADRE